MHRHRPDRPSGLAIILDGSKEELMRNSFHTVAVAVSFALLGTGCAGFGTKTFKEFNINEGTSISIDATQRVILVKDNVLKKDDGGKKTTMVCAEPSPDAMVAAAAHAAAKADVPNVGGGELSGGFSQTASSIGIRTATIQVLRDGYFRACEAAMNGMLSPESYQQILAGIGPVMVGLVAIDGLTQMGPAPIVSIGAIGGATTTKDGTKADNKVEIKVDPTNAPKTADVTAIADKVVQIVKIVLNKVQDKDEAKKPKK